MKLKLIIGEILISLTITFMIYHKFIIMNDFTWLLVVGRTVIIAGMFVFAPMPSMKVSKFDSDELVSNHKQTYREYAQERLDMERILR
ncbi:hypothetical protein M0R04_14640 [Candidatus Dojkabacteria bacterium]|jgi:hypothetical protein|nr:hypothetical protein [Candidatus Dojkabacteria bacterium]